MKVASIDIGTNTCLLLVAEIQGGQVANVLHDESRAVRLGEGVNKNRRFLPQALDRLDKCLEDYQKIGSGLGVQKWGAVATSAARDAQNKEDFFAICEKHKIPVQIISGPKEAELTFDGLSSDRTDKEGLAGIDIGGGSTEIVNHHGGKTEGQSFDVGCLRVKEMFSTDSKVNAAEQAQMRQFVRSLMSQLKLAGVRELIAVSGTPTTLAAMELGIEFDAQRINGFHVSRALIQKWIERLAGMSAPERAQVKGLDLGRADIVVPGLIILDEAAALLGFDQITVSVRGIRYGLALELGK